MNTFDTMNDGPNQIIDSFMSVLTAAVNNPDAPVEVSPVELADYQALCRDVCGPTVLSDESIDGRARRDIDQNAYVEVSFPVGDRCCPVIVPFDNYGRLLTPEQIRDGEHLYTFVINTNGVTTQGISAQNSYAFDVLPREIQAASFIIPENREDLARLYREACKKMRSLLGE